MKTFILLITLMIGAQSFATKQDKYEVTEEIEMTVKELVKKADLTKTTRR